MRELIKKKQEDQEKLIKQILDNETKFKKFQKQTKVLIPDPEQDKYELSVVIK